jgi:uncharacterized protein YceH (UPF0502 family)
MAPLGSLDHVDQVLEALIARRYARRLQRRPGQKEDRFEHLLGGDAPTSAAATYAAAVPVPPPVEDPGPPRELNPERHPEPGPVPGPAPTLAPSTARAPAENENGDLAARVSALEDEVASLRADLEALRQVGSASPTT